MSNQKLIGRLTHESQIVFNYEATPTSSASLVMPERPESYNSSSLHPDFEMNLPEGFSRRYISERLVRNTRINDMLFLALQGDRGIGITSLVIGWLESQPDAVIHKLRKCRMIRFVRALMR